MCAHSKQVVDEFCKLCDWLIQIWQLRKSLFDENPNVAALQDPRHEHFFYRLQVVLQENWLHQLAKLRDPAVQGGYINLSINYMIEYGQWVPKIKDDLLTLREKMTVLAKPIGDARNKILSHNDLAVILAHEVLGSFDPGEGELYFQVLCQFVSIVRQKALGEPFVYDNLVSNDVDCFMKTFLDGLHAYDQN